MKKIIALCVTFIGFFLTSFATVIDVQNNTSSKLHIIFSNQYSEAVCTQKQCYIPPHVKHCTTLFTTQEMQAQIEEKITPMSTIDIRINTALIHHEQIELIPGERYALDISELHEGGVLKFAISLYWINSVDASIHNLRNHVYYPEAAIASCAK